MANEEPRKRVLYAEPSELVQGPHGLALEKLGCDVVSVASAEEAFARLSFGEPFDLILVGDLSRAANEDHLRPELSVISKARVLYPDIPILIFSMYNYQNQAYEAGATAQLFKPAGTIDFVAFLTPYLFGREN